MPVTQETEVTIVCDNPACPGNSLDPDDRTGWLFVNSEVYGEPVASHVFCSASCVSAATEAPKVFAWEHAGDAKAVRAQQQQPALIGPEESE